MQSELYLRRLSNVLKNCDKNLYKNHADDATGNCIVYKIMPNETVFKNLDKKIIIIYESKKKSDKWKNSTL